MLTRVALLLVLAPAAAGAAPFVLSQTILDPAPASGDFFASSVAAVGSALVVGARFKDAGAVNGGTAYVLDGGALRTLVSPAPAAGAQFGFAVAGVGGRIAVGVPHADSGAPHSGTVYVYDAQSAALVLTIPNPTPAFDDLFGYAVAAVGDAILVGAPNDGTGAVSAGAAYLFDAQTGALLQTFLNPTPADYDLFGETVAGVGGQALVGAPFDDTAAPNAGAAYLFDAGTGALVRTFTSPRAHAGDFFGSAVAGVGASVLVGAPFDGTAASNGGAAYLFDAASGALLRTFLDPSPAPDDRFGAAVGALGGDVLVGAPFKDTTLVDSGAAYLFQAATGLLLQQFDNPTPAAGDQFGATLAAVGTSVAIGSWLDDTGADNGGALYLFVDVGAPTTTTSTPTTITSTTLTTTTATTVTVPPSSTSTTTSTTTTATPASSTVTSAPGETASTTTSLPSTTTTTTLPSGTVPTLCDDGDPCTDDRYTPARGCEHVVRAGFDGATCRLDGLAALMRGVPARALGGRRLARQLAARVSATRRLLDAARVDPARATRRLAGAVSALRAFRVAVRRAEYRGRVARPLADGMLAFAADVSGRIAHLL